MHAGIKVHDLTVRFGETTVLNNISLSFEKNKIHGLVGRNGSGKTILLKCICGFVIPASGSIKIDDQQIGQDCDVPENIGIIIEAPGFLPNYDGYTNLKFLAAIKKQISKEQILHVIEKVGLDSKSKKHVGKYSLGMRQRLGLAQALMEDPDILILDEPMNGLDNQGVKDIRTILLELKNQGKTILLASHSKEDIEILCDTVHELDLGKIINSNTKN
ncbi:MULTISPECIES: ATP-binding cassette domain-containing protein [unclassified Niallia]|uniref:ABC transporter ATP-binding protein n=1 Tax=unclassified Niallia TaxID=2837522 RepID=UPI001EDA25D8|nr:MULTISPECIES: ATP-binding cassette domain-containing protein [unclassified Niallia]MCM3030869.1 ATP-binding cassette domain-containing protein [Niallia sp. MER 6]UPO90584.1 ATP-binding cassette domain-containing protein [Niallia sp. Man26]